MPRYITIRDGKAKNATLKRDADGREDPGKASQPDQTMDAWPAENIEGLALSQEAMTQVPGDSVFDAAERLEDS